MTIERLYRVEAPHFCAGLLVGDGSRVVAAAPILNWALGMTWVEVLAYTERKGWQMEHILEPVIRSEWLKVKMAIQEGRL